MKPSKDYRAQADEGFLRAAYDLQADMALGAWAITGFKMERTARKGVYRLIFTAVADPRCWKESAQPIRYEVEWPRPEVVTLAAAIFQGFHKLDIMVAECVEADGWEARNP